MLTGGMIAVRGMMPNSWAGRPAVPILARFLGKFVLDIMPAALASVIGGFLFTQYQFGHAPAQRPAVETAAPASAEMLALVRDEHAVIVDYLKSQMAAEKSRQAAETRDADAPLAAGGAAAAPIALRVTATLRRGMSRAAMVSPGRHGARPPATMVASAHALGDAQAEPMTAPTAAACRPNERPRCRLALGEALDLSDHVVAPRATSLTR